MLFNKRKYFSNLLSRILLTIIFFLSIFVLNKYKPSLVKKIKNNLFNKSLNFIKINKVSQKLLGKDVFYFHNNEDSLAALSSNYQNYEKQKYFNAEKMIVSSDLPLGSISSGVVVYNDKKQPYNNTVIIQGMDGFNIWYGNVKNINVGLYDYVQKNDLIASADGNYIYLLIEKDNKYYSYDEYLQNKS